RNKVFRWFASQFWGKKPGFLMPKTLFRIMSNNPATRPRIEGTLIGGAGPGRRAAPLRGAAARPPGRLLRRSSPFGARTRTLERSTHENLTVARRFGIPPQGRISTVCRRRAQGANQWRPIMLLFT